MSRSRYALRITLEVPGTTLPDAIERALRLFRPQVRGKLSQSVAYVGSYRGSFLMMAREKAPPADRVNLKQRKRPLRTLPRDVPAQAPAVVTNPAPRARRNSKPIQGTQVPLFAGC